MAAAVAVGAAHSACFSLYDSSNALMLQSQDAPIDLSRSIAAEMAAKYPGWFLVMAERGNDCAVVDQRPARQGSSPNASGDPGAGRALNSLARRQGLGVDPGDDYLGSTTVYAGDRRVPPKDRPVSRYARPDEASGQPFVRPVPAARRP